MAQLAWNPRTSGFARWAKAVEARAPCVPGGNVPVGAKFATERDWVQRLSYAGRIQLLAEAKGSAVVPVQVLRIGDIVIGTSPRETFAEIGLEFTQRSPLPHSFMVSLAHGYIADPTASEPVETLALARSVTRFAPANNPIFRLVLVHAVRPCATALSRTGRVGIISGRT